MQQTSNYLCFAFSICEGRKDPQTVLRTQIDSYREVFREAMSQAPKIDEAVGRLLNQNPVHTPNEGIFQVEQTGTVR